MLKEASRTGAHARRKQISAELPLTHYTHPGNALVAIREEWFGLSPTIRHKNFPQLGYHLPRSVRPLERLRRLIFSTDMRTVFAVSALAAPTTMLDSY